MKIKKLSMVLAAFLILGLTFNNSSSIYSEVVSHNISKSQDESIDGKH